MSQKDFSMPLSDLGEPDQDFARWVAQHFGRFPDFEKWIVQEAATGRRDLRINPYNSEGLNSKAEVHFTGKLLDGTVFASSKKNGSPLIFQLANDHDVMSGFILAVYSMQVGEKAVFNIPSSRFAKSTSVRPATIPCNIPPNQTVQFEIELISVITDVFENERILKRTIKFGTGWPFPRDMDEVVVNYNASLEDGTSVSKSEGAQFSLAEGFFCPAFSHAVEIMTKGEEAVLIIQPEYGFSKQGRPPVGNEAAVPPDATLYVNLQLISWISVSRIGENGDILKKIDPHQVINGWGNPLLDAFVKVRLIGKLEDGTIFDRRGYDREGPLEFAIDEEPLICGLEEAVMAMREGEFASFTIPPQHAFGATGSSQYELAVVPPNATVIYDIELLSVNNEEHALGIEEARRKEKEGDDLFNSGKYLIAYRKYLKAKQLVDWSPEVKETFVLLAFKRAECAIKLQRYKEAYHCYHEALSSDPWNPKALQMLAHTFPSDSVENNAVPLRKVWRNPFACSASRQINKREHETRSENIFVPGQAVSAAHPGPVVSSASAATTGSNTQAQPSKKGLHCIIC